MAQAGTNFYKADLRAIRFTLYDHLRIHELFELDRYRHLDRNECDSIIEQCYRFVCEEIGPLNGVGDRLGCRFEDGVVKTPPGFREAWRKVYELGLPSFSLPLEVDGLGGPHAVGVVLQELQSGANTAFTMYPELTRGAADLIAHFGTPEQKARFLPPMLQGRFAGTMCLSEPHAGSDVGAVKTRATPIEGNVYRIEGTKCWISGGDHDLAENIVHLVLARMEGAPSGTKGLSLFIVPKFWVEEDGSLGKWNDVATASIEHKLGIRASATAVLRFGENGQCRGLLVGEQPHQGIRQMFRMMNGARIAVGVQGLAIASTAYLNALEYARNRLQGSSVRHFKDPDAPRVPIIDHSDVRRMLLEMKAKVEGMRTLAVKLAWHMDMAFALEQTDPARAAFHMGQVDLLTPVVKAYCSDQAFRIVELAIQTYGGAGYVQDHPVEQYCRDAKIFSIYEGTNHIQALDLVARKLPQHGGELFRAFVDEIHTFTVAQERTPGIATEVEKLREATQALQAASSAILKFFLDGKLDQVTLVANWFLESMGEVALAYLLLDAARVAEEKRAAAADLEGDPSAEDTDFYLGKVMAAKFFVHRFLPLTLARLQMLASDDRSALDMPDRGFSTEW